MKYRGAALALLAAAALACCLWGASGARRLTLLNTGARLEYPPGRAAWGLAGALGLALLAAGVPRHRPRVVLVSTAILAAVLAAQRLTYRLDAGPQALVARGLLGSTSLPWREVSRVDSGPDALVVLGHADARIRVSTADLHPDLRVTLERTISSRIAESRGAR
jgi:hypothetical protein